MIHIQLMYCVFLRLDTKTNIRVFTFTSISLTSSADEQLSTVNILTLGYFWFWTCEALDFVYLRPDGPSCHLVLTGYLRSRFPYYQQLLYICHGLPKAPSILNAPVTMIEDTTLPRACHSWKNRVSIHALWSAKYVQTNRSSWPGHIPPKYGNPLAEGIMDTHDHMTTCLFLLNLKYKRPSPCSHSQSLGWCWLWWFS